jgi:hypothetical protein
VAPVATKSNAAIAAVRAMSLSHGGELLRILEQASVTRAKLNMLRVDAAVSFAVVSRSGC